MEIIDENGELVYTSDPELALSVEMYNKLHENDESEKQEVETLKKWNIPRLEVDRAFGDLHYKVDHNIPIDKKKWSEVNERKFIEYIYLYKEMRKLENEIRNDIMLSILFDRKSEKSA